MWLARGGPGIYGAIPCVVLRLEGIDIANIVLRTKGVSAIVSPSNFNHKCRLWPAVHFVALYCTILCPYGVAMY